MHQNSQSETVDISSYTIRDVKAFLRRCPRTTLVCAIVSHMRRRLHAKTYRLYKGGWRTRKPQTRHGSPTSIPVATIRKLHKMYGTKTYGDTAAYWYSMSEIKDLTDQAELILSLINDEERFAKYRPGGVTADDRLLWAVGRKIATEDLSPTGASVPIGLSQ